MKNGRLIHCLALVVLSLPRPAHAQGVPPAGRPPGGPPRLLTDTVSLFLTDDDVVRVKRVLPGLANASQQGPRETASYLAKLDISAERITHVLANMSVAYSAVKFEEWMRQLRPMLDTSKPSPYRERVEQSQRRLDSLTAKYKTAKQGARTALEVNEEVVRKNLSDVEALLVHVQRLKVSSMPSRE